MYVCAIVYLYKKIRKDTHQTEINNSPWLEWSENANWLNRSQHSMFILYNPDKIEIQLFGILFLYSRIF